jgi:hypothetical protein
MLQNYVLLKVSTVLYAYNSRSRQPEHGHAFAYDFSCGYSVHVSPVILCCHKPTFLIIASQTDVHLLVHRSWQLTSVAASRPICSWRSCKFGSRTSVRLHFPVDPSGDSFVTLIASFSPSPLSVDSSGVFYIILKDMNYHTTTCECGHVCEFEEGPGLFLRFVQTAEVNAQV